jgi:hypothetical protein
MDDLHHPTFNRGRPEHQTGRDVPIETLWARVSNLVQSAPTPYDTVERAYAQLFLDLNTRISALERLHECKSVPVSAHRSGFPPRREGPSEEDIRDAFDIADSFITGLHQNRT